MRVARVGTIGVVGLVAVLLAGCDARPDLWRKKTDDIRVFITPFPCNDLSGTVPIHSQNSTFYEMLGGRWWVSDDRCREPYTRCFPDIPQSYHDGFARQVTFINELGGQQNAKVWVANRTDMGPVVSNETATRHGLYLRWSASRPNTNETGNTCVNLVTIPWQTDGNRPFWVAGATLREDGKRLGENNKFTETMVLGLAAFLVLGMFFVGAGYFGGGRRNEDKKLIRSFTFMIVGLIVVGILQRQMINEPYERLVAIQNYYKFFSGLHQTAWGQLLPIAANNMNTLMAGPPLTTDLEQPVEKFELIVLCVLGFWLLAFGKQALMGMHYLFVPHRAETFILPVLRNDERIDAGGLADALTPDDESFTDPPPAYQSQSQAEKARALKAKLDADAAIAEAAVRRERARAALADAEREVEEAKRRAKKL